MTFSYGQSRFLRVEDHTAVTRVTWEKLATMGVNLARGSKFMVNEEGKLIIITKDSLS